LILLPQLQRGKRSGKNHRDKAEAKPFWFLVESSPGSWMDSVCRAQALGVSSPTNWRNCSALGKAV